MFALLSILVVALCATATAVAQTATDTDPQAAFSAATKEMKDLVGELAVLQAKYHQPGADKKAVEVRFNEIAPKAQAASQRLEESAFALVETKAATDPKTLAEAKDICGAVAASSLQNDDPLRALAAVARLDAAGAADAKMLLLAASAATIAAPEADPAAWLAKAKAAGATAEQLTDITGLVEQQAAKVSAEAARRVADKAADDLPRVKLATSAGDIVVELFENEAPNTVANFISLVEKGFYDGTPFHRVISGFMAQGGDPTGTGTSGPGYAIACETEAPGARKHFLGTLSMANAGKNTGGSQFFLTFRPTEHLDGKHTVFGRVIGGFEVLPQRKRAHPYEPATLPDPRRR